MKDIGEVKVKNYGFPVRWDKGEQSVWIGRKTMGSRDYIWEQVGRNVFNEKDAIITAQKHIDVQYGDRYSDD